MLIEKIVEVKRNMFRKVVEYVEPTLLDAEAIKKDSLERITVRTTSGKLFYADPVSRIDLDTAIARGVEIGATSTLWKLADPVNGSKIVSVTIDELREASMLGLEAKGVIVGV